MAPEPDDHPTLYIRVPPPLKAAVVAYGKALGVSQNAAAILLLRRGLKLDPMPATDPAATEALGASLRRQIGLSDDPFEEMRGIDL